MLTIPALVRTSQKKMTTSTTTKLFNYSFSKLKANMQSTRALQRKIKLNIIVIDKIRMSNPSSYLAIEERMLMECVTEVSSLVPYLRMQMPRMRNEAPVSVLTHWSKPYLRSALI